MSLTITQRPTSPLVSLEEMKNYLKVDSNHDDALIKNLVEASSAALEGITGKSFLKKTYLYEVCSELFEGPPLFDRCIYTKPLRIPLPRPPVIRIISVKFCSSMKEARVIPPERYTLINHYEVGQLILEHRESCSYSNNGQLKSVADKLSIQFEAGFGETAESVPEPLRLAVLMLVAEAYEKRDGFSAREGLSPGVRELIQPYRLFTSL